MYQEVRLNRGTEARRGGVNVGHLVSPTSHFMLATGLRFKDTRFLNTDISLLQTVFFVPGERKPLHFL